MDLHEANGDDMPEPHYPPEVRSGEARSLYRLLANLATGLASHATRVDQRFDKIDSAFDALVRGIKLELGMRDKTPSDPPTRAESPSYHDVVEQATHEVESKIREAAERAPGPWVDADAASRIAIQVVTQKLADREAELVARANAERLAALDAKEAERKAELARQDKEREEDRRKIRVKFWSALAVAIATGTVTTATAVATYGARAAKEHSLGRMEVIQEMKVQPPPIPAASASTRP